MRTLSNACEEIRAEVTLEGGPAYPEILARLCEAEDIVEGSALVMVLPGVHGNKARRRMQTILADTGSAMLQGEAGFAEGWTDAGFAERFRDGSNRTVQFLGAVYAGLDAEGRLAPWLAPEPDVAHVAFSRVLAIRLAAGSGDVVAEAGVPAGPALRAAHYPRAPEIVPAAAPPWEAGQGLARRALGAEAGPAPTEACGAGAGVLAATFEEAIVALGPTGPGAEPWVGDLDAAAAVLQRLPRDGDLDGVGPGDALLTVLGLRLARALASDEMDTLRDLGHFIRGNLAGPTGGTG